MITWHSCIWQHDRSTHSLLVALCHLWYMYMSKNQPFLKQIVLKLSSLASYVICRRDDTQIYIGLIRDGREIAVKRVIKLLYKRLENEVKTLLDLRHHPNILEFMVKTFILNLFRYSVNISILLSSKCLCACRIRARF